MFKFLLFVCVVVSVTYGAPSGMRPGNTQLSPEGQRLVDSLRSLLNADTVSKMVQIFASQGPSSHAYIASLTNITPEAAQCVTSHIMEISQQVQSELMPTPQSVINAYLEACNQYRAQLEPMFNSFMGAMTELNATAHDNDDLPQSYRTFFDHYNEVMTEIQANPNATDNGAKLQSLLDEFQAIPEADAQVVANKLPFFRELILPSGQVHADVVSILTMYIAKLNGQDYDQASLKETSRRVMGYVLQNIPDLLNMFKTEIDNYQVPEDVANDESVTRIATAFGTAMERLANQVFGMPWFNMIVNRIVGGKFEDMSSEDNAIGA